LDATGSMGQYFITAKKVIKNTINFIK